MSASYDKNILIARFADEGVPIGVMARALRMAPADVSVVVDLAVKAKRVRRAPAADWPEEMRLPEFPVVTSAARHRYQHSADRLRLALDLTNCQALVAAIMVEDGIATMATMASVAVPFSRNQPQIIKVHASRLRTKLGTIGVQFETLWGAGYQMREPGRAVMRDIIAQAVVEAG